MEEDFPIARQTTERSQPGRGRGARGPAASGGRYSNALYEEEPIVKEERPHAGSHGTLIPIPNVAPHARSSDRIRSIVFRLICGSVRGTPLVLAARILGRAADSSGRKNSRCRLSSHQSLRWSSLKKAVQSQQGVRPRRHNEGAPYNNE
ncbi:hypothetical protein A0H81_04651 [Grifola frondosa]|uniref:Uncharacterized protein n=1 Tax=Grifola frondosa TaxID=5627 RepID=A0A1C7MGW9_GRIFR|nr:hypothetical protein A0H81_04651 [Grifola frondosa]